MTASPNKRKKENSLQQSEMRSRLSILDLKEDKQHDSGKEDEGKMFHT